ncbi:MAG: hypothetical protein P4M04_15595 [Acidobacteriota bacterium]|nr:hypothetical protein [Acidobacteriota bacterium]
MKRLSRLLFLPFCFLAILQPLAAIDREAFTITRYQLEAQVDRTAHVIAVNGKLTLRNDSNKPQKLVTLQVSSSLAWNAITLNDQPLEWLGDNYTSDIDHTGSLSEVIVTLPKEIAPASTVTLDVQYGGTITPDATRLTRTGIPAEVAVRNDWDHISNSFTAVRGLGYVVWYPVAIDAVSLSDGSAVFDAMARWKQRHERSEFAARILTPAAQQPLCIAVNGTGSTCGDKQTVGYSPPGGGTEESSNTLQLDGLGEMVPAFAIANYVELPRPTIAFTHLPEHTTEARDYALAAEANDPLLHDWLHEPHEPARVIELANPNANPWKNGAVLFTPLREASTPMLQLLLMPLQVASRLHSPHAWIQDGVERFLQVMAVEMRSGRRAALEYLDQYREPLIEAEKLSHPAAQAAGAMKASEADNTLLNTNDEVYLHGKGGFVMWMLRDMVGTTDMQRTLLAYRGGADKDPSYFQKLLQTNSKRDLEWFFDDWVYRDRGLPEFKVESVYTRPMLGEGSNFMVTVTIENRGRTGAEVPGLVQTPSGEKSVRIVVKAGQKGTGRLEVPVAPDKIVVNDGSVPEASTGNNVYDVPPPVR